ncbi:eukaryotic-type carbonic anhydrase domain-containing protein [Phthorimaea operculella]|nr:eukaryotic-type carbonic anhydrase domain-containing protein [Phthorimaea operculella]
MKRLSVIFVSIFVLVKADSDDHWEYGRESEWPGMCNKGSRQSPINILTSDAIEDYHGAHIRGPLQYHGYESVKVEAQNNGHTAVWNNLDFPLGPTLSGGPLRGNYTFMQFHLHWLSEHAIDGIKFPVEIHFVHIKQGLSPDEATKQDDGVAVIGVMSEIQYTYDSGHALKEIMRDVPKVVDQNAQPRSPHRIDVSRLFSPNDQTYFTYHGSLTTPRCYEVVTWIVMEKPLAISDEQFRMITKIDVGTLNNARSLQPANRVVYKVTGHPSANCAVRSAPAFLMTLATLVNCFSGLLGKTVKKSICVLYRAKAKFFNRGESLQGCAKYSYY